jgi:hypothetical protein
MFTPSAGGDNGQNAAPVVGPPTTDQTLDRATLPTWLGDWQWFPIRQDKHHRWSLDEAQINQYHLGGALHPHIRWWEATDVPRRTIGFVEAHEPTIASLVCEDLAQSDNVAQVIRSVGPTLLITPLLDGPQLTSRWSAGYASVFADDPARPSSS